MCMCVSVWFIHLVYMYAYVCTSTFCFYIVTLSIKCPAFYSILSNSIILPAHTYTDRSLIQEYTHTVDTSENNSAAQSNIGTPSPAGRKQTLSIASVTNSNTQTSIKPRTKPNKTTQNKKDLLNAISPCNGSMYKGTYNQYGYNMSSKVVRSIGALIAANGMYKLIIECEKPEHRFILWMLLNLFVLYVILIHEDKDAKVKGTNASPRNANVHIKGGNDSIVKKSMGKIITEENSTLIDTFIILSRYISSLCMHICI